MRLIDADKLKEHFESALEKVGEKKASLTSITRSVINMIDAERKVEAIPVEYIESTMNRWKEIIGYEESVEALRILIDNWKIERKEE